MKVQVNYHWLALMVSLVILFLIREHLVALSIYVAVFITFFTTWLLVLPKLADKAETALQSELLLCLTEQRPEEIHQLLKEQRVLTIAGRVYVLTEARGLAYSSQGQHRRAAASFRETLKLIPEEGRVRVQLNLAHTLIELNELDVAEATYRSVLSSHPDNMMAEEGLASISALRPSQKSST